MKVAETKTFRVELENGEKFTDALINFCHLTIVNIDEVKPKNKLDKNPPAVYLITVGDPIGVGKITFERLEDAKPENKVPI